MKNKFVLLLGMLMLSFSVRAQSLFNAKEFGLSLATDYTVDPSAAFRQEYAFNLSAGAFYYPWRNVGFEASLPFYSTKGPSFSEVQAGIVLRAPLSSDKPILRDLAPYVGLGCVYRWADQEHVAYLGKVGLELRFNPHWGVFAEGDYRNNNFEWERGELSINSGLRLVF